MRLAVAVATLLMLAMPAHGQPVPAIDDEFLEALHGCWARVSWPAEIEAKRADPNYGISGQMCLDGGSGTMGFYNCEGLAIDCQTIEGRYEIRDGRLWRDYGANTSGGRVDACEMVLEARWLTLANCEWVDADPGVAAIDDIRYERIVDL